MCVCLYFSLEISVIQEVEMLDCFYDAVMGISPNVVFAQHVIKQVPEICH
jgi:hypothetical protein